jgi:hypothetical protein
MRTVRLSKRELVETVANYWNSPEFPENIYIALENCVGVGEGSGGVGCGSVVNALQDLEGGGFFDMARIDELVLNIPDRKPGAQGDGAGTTGGERGPREDYLWVFAREVNGIGIEWA